MKPEHTTADTMSGRECTPGETFHKVSPFLSRLGITRVARHTGLDHIGVPVWCAYIPNARSIVIAQGKGIDDDSARTSAVMEAVERTVATQPHCEIVQASRKQLMSSGDAVHALDRLIAKSAHPVQDDEIIEWSRARNLITGQPVWLPHAAVHLDRTNPMPQFWQSSDGLASGNNLQEATLHGLLERIERDATTLWDFTPQAKRYDCRLDSRHFDHPSLRYLLDRVEQADMALALFDVTSDLGIPVITALLAPKTIADGTPLRHVDVTFGAGASLSPMRAAERAITEAIQSRMTFISGARDDFLPSTFEQALDPAIRQAFERPAHKMLHDLPSFDATSSREALKTVTDLLSGRRIDALFAVDLTPDWLPVSIVKVFAPQLENPDGERRQRFGGRALSRSLA